MSAERIHRREYTAAKAKKYISKKDSCAVILKVPEKFKHSGTKATPTPAEACMLENSQVNDDSDASRLADRTGWKYLGCGVHRCSLMFKDGAVVKFGKSERNMNYTGPEANKYEVTAYNLAPPEVKEVLTPVVAHSPQWKWIVVPAARTMENDSLTNDALRDIRHSIEDHLASVGASCRDLHGGNLGELDGNPVIIDFGFGVSCRRLPSRKQKKLSSFLDLEKPGRRWIPQEELRPRPPTPPTTRAFHWQSQANILYERARQLGDIGNMGEADFLIKEAQKIEVAGRQGKGVPLEIFTRIKALLTPTQWERLTGRRWFGHVTQKPAKGIETNIHEVILLFQGMKGSLQPQMYEKVKELIAEARVHYNAKEAGQAVIALQFAKDIIADAVFWEPRLHSVHGRPSRQAVSGA